MSSEEGDKTVEKAFKEITRVLKVEGRYLVLSLAQDNVLQLMLDFFSSHNWLIRIHKVCFCLTKCIPLIINKIKNILWYIL